MSPRGRRQPVTDVHKSKSHTAADPVQRSREAEPDHPSGPVTTAVPEMPAVDDSTELSTIAVPVAAPSNRGFAARHLDIQLPMHHVSLVKRMFNALHRGNYRLRDGRHVDRPPQVIIWLLDQIGIGLGSPSQASLPMPGFQPGQVAATDGGVLGEQCEAFVASVLKSLVPAGEVADEWIREHCQVLPVGETQTVMVDGNPVGQFQTTIEATRISYEFERFEL